MISEDPLRQAVIDIVRVMRTDYAGQFSRAYPGSDERRELRRRLAEKLNGLAPVAILDGYEAVAEAHPGILPTVAEIVASARARQQIIDGRAEAAKRAARHAGAIGDPDSGLARAVEALARDQAGNPAAQREIDEMREILKRAPPADEAERLSRRIAAQHRMASLLLKGSRPPR